MILLKSISYHIFNLLIYNEPLELVFMDIWGPSFETTTNGSRYYLVFLDVFSKFTQLYIIHNKTYILNVFKRFKVFLEN